MPLNNSQGTPLDGETHLEWEALLPFYVNRTLPAQQVQALEGHLATCATCQQSLNAWQGIAQAMHAAAEEWSRDLPPLSDTVRARMIGASQPPNVISMPALPKVVPGFTPGKARKPGFAAPPPPPSSAQARGITLPIRGQAARRGLPLLPIIAAAACVFIVFSVVMLLGMRGLTLQRAVNGESTQSVALWQTNTPRPEATLDAVQTNTSASIITRTATSTITPVSEVSETQTGLSTAAGLQPQPTTDPSSRESAVPVTTDDPLETIILPSDAAETQPGTEEIGVQTFAVATASVSGSRPADQIGNSGRSACPYPAFFGNRCMTAADFKIRVMRQRFEYGTIYLRSDTDAALVLFDSGEIGEPGSADLVSGTPPEGLFAPAPEMIAHYQAALGWATDTPVIETVTLQGLSISLSSGETLEIGYEDGNFTGWSVID